jgi:hypothetical protein
MGFWRKDRKATCVYKEAHLGGADADFDGGKLVTAFDGDFVGGRNRLRGLSLPKSSYTLKSLYLPHRDQ